MQAGYKNIIDKYEMIKSVTCKGNQVIVNGDVYSFKFAGVAKAVAKKISYFKGAK